MLISKISRLFFKLFLKIDFFNQNITTYLLNINTFDIFFIKITQNVKQT